MYCILNGKLIDGHDLDNLIVDYGIINDECSIYLIFKYGDVGFAKDEKPDGTLPMRFKYDIIMNPFEKDTTSQEFIDYIGDLLIELLEKQLTDGKVEFK